MKIQLKKMIRLCLLALFLPVVGSAYAQVKIGNATGDPDPRKGALLDLDADTLGVLFPKVNLVKFDDLKPLITHIAHDEKVESKGMVVYNTNDQADGVAVGFVVWNGEEWQSLAGGGVSMSKVSSIDCDKIQIKGTYLKGKPLDPVANKIILPVHVDRKGKYDVLVEVYQADQTTSNEYLFAGSGEFYTNQGVMPVTVAGQGVPLKENDAATLDYMKIYINGQEIACTGAPGIPVSEKQPDYSFKCEHVSLDMPSANCVPGHRMTTDDYISIRVTTPMEAAGAYWHITTNTVNGVLFEGSGPLKGGTENLILYGDGTIDKAGTFTYTITTNNLSSQTCTMDMNVMYNSTVKIKVFSEASGYGIRGDSKSPAIIAKNTALFGLGADENAVLSLSANSLKVISTTSDNVAPSDTEDYSGVALVLVGYNVSLSATAMQHLFDYVKQGGVAFISCENNTNLPAIGLQLMLNTVSSPGNTVSVTSASDDNALVPLVGNSPLVRGHYDLKGKQISRNGGGQRDFSSFSADWEMIAGTGSKARLIKHKDGDLYIGGDGGMLSGSTTNDPARVDSSGNPLVSGTNDSTAGGYNSHLLANLMLYAVQKYIGSH